MSKPGAAMAVRKRGPWQKFKMYWPLLLLTLPGIIYLICNNYIPMSFMYIAFKQVKYNLGLWASPWIGFKNFKFLFRTADAWLITRNTVCYNLVFIIVNNVMAVAVAIMLNDIRSKLSRKIYQSCILMPYLVSMIIVSYLAYAFLQSDYGFFNSTILPLFGLEPINWYAYPKAWPFILTFINCWKQVGYLSIVFYASVVGISPEYFEAARVDGASKMQQIRRITLPMLRPTIVIMTLLAVGRIFSSDFGLFYQVPMDSGALYSVTNTLDTYVYRALMSRGDIGMSSAACFYQSIVGFAMVMLSNFVVSKIDPDSALF